MICTRTYENGILKTDTDRIAERCVGNKPLYVYASDAEERARLAVFLEKEGFRCAKQGPASVRDLREPGYPLTVDLNVKTVSRMGNTVCAAAAAGSGLVMGSEDFYLLYSLFRAEGRGSVSGPGPV